MGRLWAYSGFVLSKVSVTSARPFGPRDSEPLKITSSMFLPRRCFGLCSPRTQRIASTMFDLPQPFGPTTPVTPEGKSRTVRWGKDLNPTSSSCLIRIPLPPPPPRFPLHRTGGPDGQELGDRWGPFP